MTTSLSAARRIPWQQVLEVSYVGTFGRHLLNTRQYNVIAPGTLSQGRIGNADLSNPLHRAAVGLNSDLLISLRPFPALGNVRFWEYNGDVELPLAAGDAEPADGPALPVLPGLHVQQGAGHVRRQRRIRRHRPLRPRNRTYGTLSFDRTHILNVSYNYAFPDATSRGGVLGALTNGWQFSGISTYASGLPISVGFSGDIAARRRCLVRHAATTSPSASRTTGAGQRHRPRSSPATRGIGGKSVGEKILNVNCIGIPTVRPVGPLRDADLHPLPHADEPRHHAVQELRPRRREQEAAVPRWARSTSSTRPRPA